jgi:hypothetical protein
MKSIDLTSGTIKNSPNIPFTVMVHRPLKDPLWGRAHTLRIFGWLFTHHRPPRWGSPLPYQSSNVAQEATQSRMVNAVRAKPALERTALHIGMHPTATLSTLPPCLGLFQLLSPQHPLHLPQGDSCGQHAHCLALCCLKIKRIMNQSLVGKQRVRNTRR